MPAEAGADAMANGTVTDEMLMALADGVLDEAEERRLAGLVAADPALARRLAALRAGSDAARRAYAAVVEEPVPDRLLAAVLAADATASGVAPPQPANARGWARAAVAAGLVAFGIALGAVSSRVLQPDGGGELAALPPLVTAALSSAMGGDRLSVGADSVTLLSTHRMGDGTICRVFAAEGAVPATGLACREAGAWRLTALVRRSASGGVFRPAGGLDPVLEELLERRAAGPALPVADEAALRARGW